MALLAGVGAVAGLALVGKVRGAPSVMSSLGFDDGSGRPTLYAMLDQAPLADQLKHLQCYRKMAEDAGMQLAVGSTPPTTSRRRYAWTISSPTRSRGGGR